MIAQAAGQPSLRLGFYASRLALAAVILFLCTAAIFPFYWMIVTSIRPSALLFEYPPRLLPSPGSVFSPYMEIFRESGLVQWLWNSTVVSLSTALVASLFGAMAAYSLARFHLRTGRASEMMFLLTQMLPGILLALPMYPIYVKLGLLDSLYGLSLVYLAFLIPVATALLKPFFEAIPAELEEASLIDGASRIQTLFRITLPLSLPGLASTFLFCFIIAWDEYLYARVFIRDPDRWTISVGLASFSGEFVTPWDQVMAAATVTTLPAVLIFFALQRYLVRGLTAGGIKG